MLTSTDVLSQVKIFNGSRDHQWVVYHPACRVFFVFLNEKEKKRLHLNHIKPLSSRVVNLVFPLQTGFFECEHPFIDKPLAINEPAVASARLVGLGPKLYQSKKVQQGSHSIHAGIFLSTPKGSAGRIVIYTMR